jgi:hypothetical protein
MSAEKISENDLTALAAHLHVQLRRRTGRVTDVEWLVSNAEYAQAIIQMAKASAFNEGAPELGVWAARFEMALMKVQRPRKPLLSALAMTGASTGTSPYERQEVQPAHSRTHDSQFADGIVSEFGDSHHSIDTSHLPTRKPLREAYVWSLR